MKYMDILLILLWMLIILYNLKDIHISYLFSSVMLTKNSYSSVEDYEIINMQPVYAIQVLRLYQDVYLNIHKNIGCN